MGDAAATFSKASLLLTNPFTALCALLLLPQPAYADLACSPVSSFGKCNRLLKQKHYDECVAILRKEISVKGSRELWQCLGTVYYRKGDLYRAEKAFKIGLSCDQQYWYLWGGLARVFYDLGRYDESAQALARANILKARQGIVKPITASDRQNVSPSRSPLPEPSPLPISFSGPIGITELHAPQALSILNNSSSAAR